MKLITANLLNRFWKNGIKPIKTAIDNHVSAKASASVLGNVKLTDSAAVTDSTGLALPATEKNASVKGTLANQISVLNTDLNNFDLKSATPAAGIVLYKIGRMVTIHINTDPKVISKTWKTLCLVPEEYKPVTLVHGCINIGSGTPTVRVMLPTNGVLQYDMIDLTSDITDTLRGTMTYISAL